jgi:hypothetical protein
VYRLGGSEVRYFSESDVLFDVKFKFDLFSVNVADPDLSRILIIFLDPHPELPDPVF